MIPAASLRVSGQPLPFGGHLPGEAQIVADAVPKVIRIDELVPGVVRRVDVDHLHLAAVALLQELQNLKILALDEDVLCGIPVDGFLAHGHQRCRARNLDRAHGVCFAGPSQAVALPAGLHVIPEGQAQLVEIYFAFGEHFREDLFERARPLGDKIARFEPHLRCHSRVQRTVHRSSIDCWPFNSASSLLTSSSCCRSISARASNNSLSFWLLRASRSRLRRSAERRSERPAAKRLVRLISRISFSMAFTSRSRLSFRSSDQRSSLSISASNSAEFLLSTQAR